MTRLNWIVATVLALPAWAHAHDYPTAERVMYVQACMHDNPGGYYEMLNKCSCVMDRIAGEVPFEQFEEMSTVAKATSIGGERGSYIRDAEPLQLQLRKFRAVQAQARKSCMIGTDAPR